MDMRKYAGESFIKVDDVRAGPLQLRIAVIKEGQYDKPNIVFETGDVLGLNATNTKILVRAYGADSENWVGKEIKLKLGIIPYQGKDQDAVIVEPISPSIRTKEKAAEAKSSDDETSPF